jgi:uncharacterized protein
LPSVIETHPVLEDGEPFPTMWWLTCRRLAAAVGRLEGEGFMAEINGRLAADASFREVLEASTRAYINRRDQSAPLGESSHPGSYQTKVKCLHAHVAHQLVTGDNPVGAAALEKIGWTEPGEPCVGI